LPYLAGALAGIVTVRIAPTPVLEAAPFWGLLSGSLAGVVIGFGAKFSGGPLGAGRLASVGPAGAEVGLVAVLEVGVTAAVVAGAANWLVLRYHIRRLASASASASATSPEGSPVLAATAVADHAPASPMPAHVVDENDTAGGHRIFYDPWANERDTES